MITTLWKHVDNPTGVLAPSSALRISINTGPAAFYGEKYKVEKVGAIINILLPAANDLY